MDDVFMEMGRLGGIFAAHATLNVRTAEGRNLHLVVYGSMRGYGKCANPPRLDVGGELRLTGEWSVEAGDTEGQAFVTVKQTKAGSYEMTVTIRNGKHKTPSITPSPIPVSTRPQD